jgi:hypothetical protein
VLISVGATVWGVETQRQDARVINLAGRQRMLTHGGRCHQRRLAGDGADAKLNTIRHSAYSFIRQTALRAFRMFLYNTVVSPILFKHHIWLFLENQNTIGVTALKRGHRAHF